MCAPGVTLNRFIPSHKKKLEPAGFVHVPYTNNINMVYSKDLSIMKVAVIGIVVTIIVMLEEHNVTVRRPWIYHVLSPADIIRRVIKSRKVVVVDSIPLEENRITFLAKIR
jgi:hypothetical protein